MRKTSGNVFSSFKGPRRVSFSYFPNFALDHEGCLPPITLKTFKDNITIFSSSAMEHLKWINL